MTPLNNYILVIQPNQNKPVIGKKQKYLVESTSKINPFGFLFKKIKS